MHPYLNIALSAAHDAADALAHSSDRLDRVKVLDDSPDQFLTSMDMNADKTVLYHLQKAYPSHSFHSRVSGMQEGSESNTIWLIDPLVGNQNFSRGYPCFAVSIACQIDNQLAHAVVVNPLLQEEFSATRGNGAHQKSRRIRVDSATKLNGTLINLNPGPRPVDRMLSIQAVLAEHGAMPRIQGCTALDMTGVAAGRAAAGWSPMETQCSLAAASLILQEAGGLIANEQGNPDFYSGRELVYGNPKCFRHLLKLLPS